jgi:DNA mismatch repair protein MutS
LEQPGNRVRNFNIAVKEWNDEIIFLRKLVPGGTNRSYGIQVARLAGIPDGVLLRARQILHEVETRERPVPDAGRSRDGGLRGHRQLTLFHSPEEWVAEKLSRLDPDQLTPLEALTLLSEMVERVRTGSH